MRRAKRVAAVPKAARILAAAVSKADWKPRPCYWTVTYAAADGRRWWVRGSLLGWVPTDDWTLRDRLPERIARDVCRIFKRNLHNHGVRLVRVVRKGSGE